MLTKIGFDSKLYYDSELAFAAAQQLDRLATSFSSLHSSSQLQQVRNKAKAKMKVLK